MTDTENEPQSSGYSWILWLILTCVAIVLYGFTTLETTESNLLRLLGYCVPIALVSWMLYLVLFARRYGARVRLVSLLAIYTSLVVSGYVAHIQQEREARHALMDVKGRFSALLTSNGEDEPDQFVHGDTSVPEMARLGKYGEFVRFMRGTMAANLSLKNEYLLELLAIGWDKVLDTDRVTADKTFVESRFITRRAKEIVAKYRAKSMALMDESIGRAQGFDFGESGREEMRSSYLVSAQQSRRDAEKMWDLEAESVAEFDAVIRLLSQSAPHWSAQNGAFVFERDRDLAEFNDRIATIRELASEQHAIRVRNIDAFDTAFDVIGKLE